MQRDAVDELYRLTNCDYSIPTIHVTGTNGKGSTVSFVAEMLRVAGLKVGAFVSPHLVSPRDSILIENLPISATHYEQARAKVEAVMLPINSAFEVLTVTALLLFNQFRIDVAVVEAGFGAVWDSTMIIKDEAIIASVITSVALDHVGIIGTTLQEIARSKSAIARRGKPLIINRLIQPSLISEITKAVKPRHCPVILSPSVQMLPDNHIEMLGCKIPALKMKGDHQLHNFAVAAAVALNVLGRLLTSSRRRELLEVKMVDVLGKAACRVRVAGRLECLPWPPLPSNQRSPSSHLVREISRTDYRQSQDCPPDSQRTISTASSFSTSQKPALGRTNTMPLSICVSNRSFYFDPPGFQSRLGQVKRLVWLDGAHNVEGLEAIGKWVRRCDLVICAFSQKSAQQLANLIRCLQGCKRICYTRFPPICDLPHAKCVDPVLCCEITNALFPDMIVEAAENLTAAFEEADRIYHNRDESKNNMEVLVTGSLYLVSDYYQQFLTPQT